MSRREHVKEEHPAEESKSTAAEREEILDRMAREIADKALREAHIDLETLSKEVSRGIDALQSSESKQAEADGKEKLSEAEMVIVAPADRAASGEAKEVPELRVIIAKLDQIIMENKELKESMQQTRCQRFLNVMGVFGTGLTLVATIWGFLYAYSSSTSTSFSLSDNSRLLDTDESPREKLLKILSTWQDMRDADWWKLLSDYLRANADWTINDHMVFLQFTMSLSPMTPFVWNTYKDQLGLVNKLIDFYKKDGVYISDIYQEITKKEYYYQDAALPRATAANVLLLALGGILVNKIPTKRAIPLTPKNHMVISGWDSKTTPAKDSLWVQKDTQVRYAIAYIRDGNESLRMWSDWSYVEKGASCPTLQNICKPEELIDSVRLYRQFGTAAKNQQPSGKGISLLIQEFKASTELPERYQDMIPAPTSDLKFVAEPLRQVRDTMTESFAPTRSHGEHKSERPVSHLTLEAKSQLMISDDTSQNISIALDIVGALVWSVPEIAPFVNGAIILVKWLFGFGTGTDYTSVLKALVNVEKDIIGFIQGSLEQQQLRRLADRIQAYANWMSNSAKILSDLERGPDPIVHTTNAILQKKGILEELREATTPKEGSLYSVIQALLNDPDFALPEAKSPQPYRDYEHFERVKLKCRFLILGISVYMSSLKTQIMLQRFVKQNLNVDPITLRDLDDTATYTMLYTQVRGQNGFYDRVRTDIDLTSSSSTSIFLAIVARRQAMISKVIYRTTQDVHPSKVLWEGDSVPPPYLEWPFPADTGSSSLLMDFLNHGDRDKPRYRIVAIATPAAIVRQHVETGYDFQQTYHVYGSFFADACWPQKEAGSLEQSYFYPDHSIIQLRSDSNAARWGISKLYWYLFNWSQQQSDTQKSSYNGYKDDKTQEIKDLLNLKNGKGDVVVKTWLDVVALEDTRYQPITPIASMVLTTWDTESKRDENSAWFQKDVQVRYALVYQRKGGGESKESWTDWYPVKGINPTLENIPTPDVESKISCMWILRQFGVSVDGNRPDSNKTKARHIMGFSNQKEKFPSTYHDKTPAPVSLLNSEQSSIVFAAVSTRSTHSAEIKALHFTHLFSRHTNVTTLSVDVPSGLMPKDFSVRLTHDGDDLKDSNSMHSSSSPTKIPKSNIPVTIHQPRGRIPHSSNIQTLLSPQNSKADQPKEEKHGDKSSGKKDKGGCCILM